MAASTALFNTTAKHLDDDVDWSADTIKVALVDAGYTFDPAHEFFSQVTNELAAGNGYTAGGATLTGKSRTITGAVTAYLAANTAWTPGSTETLTARRAIVYKDTGSAATSPLLCSVLLDVTPADVSATGAALTLDWHDTEGVLKSTRN